jgi:branched-chain amino acid transport system substrate-binding protein
MGRNGFTSAFIACMVLAFARPALADETTGITDTTIRIGMFGPMTGPQSSWGTPVHDGAIMVYQEVNAKGGINGRKIEVVQEDGGCDAAPTLGAVKKLIFVDKVFMINGGICSGATMAARPEVIDNKVPMVLFAASLDAITAPVAHYVFTVAPTGRYDGVSMATFAKSIPGLKRVAVVSHADDWAKAKYEGFVETAKSAGIEIVANETLDKNVTDATAQVLAIKRANPDAVLLLTYPGPSAAFLRDAHKYNLKTKFIGNNSLIDLAALSERAGGADAVRTTYVTSALVGPLASKELAPYETMLKTNFPSDSIKADSFYGTASAIVVVEALKRAGRDLTREKFIAALEGLRGFDSGIAPCPISLSPANHQGCQSQTIWTLRDGKIVNVGPTWKSVP